MCQWCVRWFVRWWMTCWMICLMICPMICQWSVRWSAQWCVSDVCDDVPGDLSDDLSVICLMMCPVICPMICQWSVGWSVKQFTCAPRGIIASTRAMAWHGPKAVLWPDSLGLTDSCWRATINSTNCTIWYNNSTNMVPLVASTVGRPFAFVL